MAGTLFGKPRSQVIKRPGALRRKARAAGMSTQAFADAHASDKGLTGKQARLAQTFRKMRAKR